MKLAKALLTIAIVLALCFQVAIGHYLAAFVYASIAAATLHGFNSDRKDWTFCFANTLTNLIADTYVALDIVSRELVGFIPSVGRNSSLDRCALNATIR